METISIVTGNSDWDPLPWVSLLVGIGAVVFTIYWNFRAERRAYMDEYWFRQIVAPKCVDPILAFHESWSLKVRNLDASLDIESVKKLLFDFQLDKALVLDGTWVSRIFSRTFYSDCCNALDEVEDVFAVELGRLVLDGNRLSAVHVRLRDSLGSASARVLFLAAQIHDGKLRLGKIGFR